MQRILLRDDVIFKIFRSSRGGTGCSSSACPVHLVNHFATMTDLHRVGRYDRRSEDVLKLTGQGPLSLQAFVRNNAATFTKAAAPSQPLDEVRLGLTPKGDAVAGSRDIAHHGRGGEL